ncbi:unnamed protein product [Lota lota]
MLALCRTLVVKGELSCKDKLSVYQLLCSPVLNRCLKLWVVTEKRRLRIKAARTVRQESLSWGMVIFQRPE